MNRNDYINLGAYTDNIKQQKAERLTTYHQTRRKLNILGGIISAAITIYFCTQRLGIDLHQQLTDDDKIKIAGVYFACLFAWRIVRQKLQAAFTPPQVFGDDERKAIEEMTPSQARQVLREQEQLEKHCKIETSGKNAAAAILIFCVLAAYVLFIKGGKI